MCWEVGPIEETIWNSFFEVWSEAKGYEDIFLKRDEERNKQFEQEHGFDLLFAWDWYRRQCIEGFVEYLKKRYDLKLCFCDD